MRQAVGGFTMVPNMWLPSARAPINVHGLHSLVLANDGGQRLYVLLQSNISFLIDHSRLVSSVTHAFGENIYGMKDRMMVAWRRNS
jgi:hypothetical protein